MAVTEIKNFAIVDDRIASAGQPTESQLRDLATDGYRAVINLGLLGQRYSLADEAGLVASLAMSYRHIPVQFEAPTPEDFDTFVAAMDAHATERVLVHCAANFRVTSFLALYGELRLGWTRAQADALARRFWDPNEAWLALLAACRAKHLSG